MRTKRIKEGIVILALIITGITAWLGCKSDRGHNYKPFRSFSDDTLFLAQTSDFLSMNNSEYLLSESPIFGLPDALDIFSFGDNRPFMGILSMIPQSQDKDYAITWILRQKGLEISVINFLYDNEVVEKYYPDYSYLEPIAKAAKKYWKQQAPDSIPEDVANWNLAYSVRASWYTGTLYAKKVAYASVDSVQVDGVYKLGFPVLKLKFKNGVLESQEELWQLPFKSDTPPPNPFEDSID